MKEFILKHFIEDDDENEKKKGSQLTICILYVIFESLSLIPLTHNHDQKSLSKASNQQYNTIKYILSLSKCVSKIE